MHNNSNAYIVSLCRDKYFSEELVSLLGFPCPSTFIYRYKEGWLSNCHPPVGCKVIAKLNYETSSIGLSVQNVFSYFPERDDFILKLSEQYKQGIVIQEFVSGYEIEVPVIIDSHKFAVAPMGVFFQKNKPLGDTILDFSSRNSHEYQFINFHTESEAAADEVERIAIDAARTLGIQGLGRIDFRVTEDNFKPYITDIATNPSIHKQMSAYQAFCERGFTYQDMMTILVGLTLSRYSKV